MFIDNYVVESRENDSVPTIILIKCLHLLGDDNGHSPLFILN